MSGDVTEESALRRMYADEPSPLKRLMGDKPRPVRVFDDFAGCGGRFKGVSLALRALTQEDLAKSGAAAIRYLVETCGWTREDLCTDTGEAMLTAEMKLQHLALALRRPEEPRMPFADDASELRSLLEVDEVGALYERLLDYQDERSPFSRAKSWEEVEELVGALGKGSTSPTRLLSFDSVSLRNMLLCTALELHRRTKVSSLPTSLSTDTGTSSMTPTP